MTNKFFSSVDGNHSRVASDLPSRCSRLASLSIVSRQSVLSILLLCLTLFVGVGQMWGAEGTTHDFSQSLSVVLNSGASISDVTVAEQSYTVKEVKVTVNYNKSRPGATVSVKVGGVTFGSAQTINSSTTTTFTYTSASAVKGQVVVSSVNNCTSSSGNGTFKITNVQLVEGAAAAPSYTVTATSNNNSYGTVSVSGTTITATPADCYQVASGASGYTVTSGTATVSHSSNSNTLTVTPSSNCTVQVNFEKKTVNTYIDEIQDNGTTEDCGTHDAPTLSNKTQAQSGTCAQQHWHFAGWTTEAHKASPEGHIITGGTSMTANGTTYYAVWSKGVDNSSSKSYSLTITSSDVPSSYAGSWSAIDANEVGGTGTYSVELDGTNVMPGSQGNTGKIQFKASSTGFYNTENLGSITSITTNNTDIKYYINTASDPSSNGANGGGFFRVYNNVNNARYSSSITINFTKTTGSATFSDYICTCCEELVSINGSFNRYHLKIFHHIIMSMFTRSFLSAKRGTVSYFFSFFFFASSS